MNKIALFLIPLIVFTIFKTSCAQEGYKIEVKVKGSQDSVMYLVNYFADKQYIKDTVENRGNGRFVFEGEEPLPHGIYIAARQDKNYFEFLVTDNQNFSLTTSYDDLVGDMKVKGSKENKYFYQFLHFSGETNKKINRLKTEMEELAEEKEDKKEALQDKIDSLNQSIPDYKEEFIEKHAGTFMAEVYNATRDPEVPDAPEELSEEEKEKWQYNYYVKHYFDNLDLSDERMLHTPVLHQRVSDFVENVLVKDPDSVIKAVDRLMEMTQGNKEIKKYLTWYITNHSERSEIMGMDKVYVHMVDNYFDKEQTPWVSQKVLNNLKERADILRKLLIGKKAPNMILEDTSGNLKPLHAVEADYLIVYFWEADCGHCQRKTPKLKKLYDEMKNQGVEVYSIYIDRNTPDKWKEYIIDNELDWINVYDGRKWTNFGELYDIYATPTVYLLDKNKKILAKRVDMKQLRELIERNQKMHDQ
ncbi:MAG: DUF5106 domain-containing protein [Bacteroidales bacterium]